MIGQLDMLSFYGTEKKNMLRAQRSVGNEDKTLFSLVRSAESFLKKKKKSETELTASVMKKRSKTQEKNGFELDETVQNVQLFEEVLFVKLRTTENS